MIMFGLVLRTQLESRWNVDTFWWNTEFLGATFSRNLERFWLQLQEKVISLGPNLASRIIVMTDQFTKVNIDFYVL